MTSARRTASADLLLGEWACLGIVAAGPTHGFAVAARLRPEGAVGRVWSLSRPLTYRSLDQLVARGLIEARGEEQGVAGGTRTILAITRAGRTALRAWLARPVEHLRDLRSELLLKLVLAELNDTDSAALIDAQRCLVELMASRLGADADAEPGDVVLRWRAESARAALRFLDGVAGEVRQA
jgi:PadR family transcriptional regulator AphA